MIDMLIEYDNRKGIQCVVGSIHNLILKDAIIYFRLFAKFHSKIYYYANHRLVLELTEYSMSYRNEFLFLMMNVFFLNK